MRAIVFVGTSGGAGVTTLVALTFTGLRDAGAAPWVFAPERGDTLDRAHQAEAPHADRGAALWDAGVLRPDASLAALRGSDVRLVLVAPATPVGAADASDALERLAGADQTLAATSSLVLTGVHGPRRHSLRGAFGVPVHQIPYDPALVRPGPVAAHGELRRDARRAIRSWCAWVALTRQSTG
ncbi:hypothetical protein QUV83_05485 [Cellulomonas cellasea]|uniref:hypothetical protein n=1 Tax=Cellulomonas cellasea TaxID=43670 RepID=UPI0025A421E3|nr:hypothetical protein [Cellulomonas cellasea]MDM8084210.1 hypothetical protein [Cellulomonas cellasea]